MKRYRGSIMVYRPTIVRLYVVLTEELEEEEEDDEIAIAD